MKDAQYIIALSKKTTEKLVRVWCIVKEGT